MGDNQAEGKWLLDLKETLVEEGALKVGFADLIQIPVDQRKGMPRGISIAVPLNLTVINGLGVGMTGAYYKEYYRANAILDKLAQHAADIIKEHGYEAFPMTVESVKDSFAGHKSELPHKTVATRAAMGWIGRSALLVTKELGSAVRITSVLTDAPLLCAEPVNESSCGTCDMCVRNCPGQAPLGPAWSVTSSREDFVNILACRKTCVERSWRVAPGMSMCSLCVLVCPWTQKAIEKEGLTYGFPAAEMAEKGDLEEILALQKKAFSGEASCIGCASIPPMLQTIDDIKAEYTNLQQPMIFLKIVLDRTIVGSVRAYEKDGTCYIGRLVVHPDYQGKGLGKRLMRAIETCYKGARFELFTRADSVRNIGFYKSLGYNAYDLRIGPAGVKFAFLEKNVQNSRVNGLLT